MLFLLTGIAAHTTRPSNSARRILIGMLPVALLSPSLLAMHLIYLRRIAGNRTLLEWLIQSTPAYNSPKETSDANLSLSGGIAYLWSIHI
jgi:hypothetical protein